LSAAASFPAHLHCELLAGQFLLQLQLGCLRIRHSCLGCTQLLLQLLRNIPACRNKQHKDATKRLHQPQLTGS
jgi:hypothetical protein